MSRLASRMKLNDGTELLSIPQPLVELTLLPFQLSPQVFRWEERGDIRLIADRLKSGSRASQLVHEPFLALARAIKNCDDFSQSCDDFNPTLSL